MSNETDAQRGQQAQAVLDNAVYQDAFTKIEAGIVDRWKASQSQDEREDCHRLLGVLHKVHAVLDSTMRSGKLAAAEIERKRKFTDRLKITRP